MSRLLLATSNPGKVKDFRLAFEAGGWQLITPADVGLSLDVEETGSTYAENARLKAQAYLAAARQGSEDAIPSSGIATIGEDSGLEIDALHGAPGLYSARWQDLPDGPIKNARVLSELQDVPSRRRTCRYRCTIVLLRPDASEQVFEGRCAGRIALAPGGSGGFGFDPIVLIPHLRRTLAELSDEERIAINHRGQAIRRLARYLGQLGPG